MSYTYQTVEDPSEYSTGWSGTIAIVIAVIALIAVIILIVIAVSFSGTNSSIINSILEWTIIQGTLTSTLTTESFIANSNHIYKSASTTPATTGTVTIVPGLAGVTSNVLTAGTTTVAISQFGPGSVFIIDNTLNANTIIVAPGSGASYTTGSLLSPNVAGSSSGTFVWDTTTTYHRLS